MDDQSFTWLTFNEKNIHSFNFDSKDLPYSLGVGGK